MPRSKKRIYKLSAALIENAHDYGIGKVWPGVEPVDEATCLNLNLLHSAARQPYQHCFGRELYPSLAAKAAYLFIHIASGHIFTNGNKRTAALCLDALLLVNSQYLTLSNTEVYDLAISVASFGERNERFQGVLDRTTTLVEHNMIPLSHFQSIDMGYYRYLHRRKWMFRNAPINRPNAPLAQKR